MSKKCYLLGNYVKHSDDPEDKVWIEALDMIVQSNIFFDKIYPDEHIDLFVKRGEEEIDENFIMLRDRLEIGPQPVLLLTGYVGTGKSTTLRFLVDYINKSNQCPCKDEEQCPISRPLAIYHSFQKSGLDNEELSISDAKAILIRETIDVLSSALYKTSFMKNELNELKDFWDYGISLSENNYYENPAFNWITSQLRTEAGDINRRKQVLNKMIENGGEAYLCYLFTFYGYIRRVLLPKHPLCVFIVFDDLDHSTLNVQEALIELLSRYVHDPKVDPQILISIRPESSAGKNFGTIFRDRVKHISPDGLLVLLKRLERSINSFKEIYQVLSKNHYLEDDPDAPKILETYLRKLYNMLLNQKIVKDFIYNVSNGSSRLSIYLADGLLMIPRHKMSDEKFSRNDLIRACITRGKPTYRPTKKKEHPIHNLYSFDGFNRSKILFIKLRVLKLLKDERNLRSLVTNLSCFDYGLDIQLAAINDLLRKPWPLIYSSGTEKYLHESELQSKPLDVLSRTDLGFGYAKYLWKEFYYVQEMMFHCCVSDERFNISNLNGASLKDNNMLDRFELVHKFLQNMLDQDKQDTIHFLESKRKPDDYYNIFGHDLYAYRIINTSTEAILKISDEQIALNIHNKAKKYSWEKIKSKYIDIKNWAWHINQDIVFKRVE